jgi:teichuronic acid biosynthesis glycosyltransferase TuaC
MGWKAAMDRGNEGFPGLRVLTVSRNYPNRVLPLLGLWTQRLTQCVARFADVKVVSPSPYVPPLPGVGPLRSYARYRAIDRQWWDGPVEVLHPRLLTGPGYRLHNVEVAPYALAVIPVVRRLQRRFPFDLIHAHFGYPDGVVANMLGRMYGVPVVMTEHAPWLPWMERYPLVRRQATWAAQACAAHIAVSQSLRDSIVQITGNPAKVQVIPNVVDGELFRLRPDIPRIPGQILFVGALRHCKGVDVLFEALRLLLDRRPDARLILAGEAFYHLYQREADRLQQLARSLGVADRVETLGGKSPADVAELMAQIAVVALPSRAESFGAVLIEALACGTPVVSTRCGGPEEVVTPAVGHLTQPEDAPALADALADVLEHGERYVPAALRQYALERYGVPVVADQLARLYGAVLDAPSTSRIGAHAAFRTES